METSQNVGQTKGKKRKYRMRQDFSDNCVAIVTNTYLHPDPYIPYIIQCDRANDSILNPD